MSENAGDSTPHLTAFLFCELATNMIASTDWPEEEGRPVLAGVVTRMRVPVGTLVLPKLALHLQFWGPVRSFSLVFDWRKDDVSFYKITQAVEPDAARERGPAPDILINDCVLPLRGPGWYQLWAMVGEVELGTELEAQLCPP